MTHDKKNFKKLIINFNRDGKRLSAKKREGGRQVSLRHAGNGERCGGERCIHWLV